MANLLIQDARSKTDEFERLVLLKRAVKTCPDYLSWLELGKVQLALENPADAVKVLESARDFYTPDATGSMTRDEMLRQAIANAWLAEAFHSNGELAAASVASEESRDAFQRLDQAPPQRLTQLQAELDDALASASSTTLTRSFQIQHERATRGIGVRPTLRPERASAETQTQTAQLEAEYDPSTAATEQTSATVVVAAADVVRPPGESATGSTGSRLNIPVLFEHNSAELSATSQNTVVQLGKAISALELDSNANVIVIGHTDATGPAAYNQQLSVQRANAVMSAIQQHVEGRPLFQAVGMGEEQLRYSGNSKDDHRRNRRVEIIVRR